MPTVKIIHFTHKLNSDGTSPIVIQVFDGKRYKRTLGNVLPEHWDNEKKRVRPKTNRNYASLNILISDEFSRVEKLIIGRQFNIQRDFVDYFDKTETARPQKLNFRQIADLYLQTILAKNAWTYNAFGAIINKFLRLIGDEHIFLSDINDRVIQKWLSAMQADKNKESTIHLNVRVVKFVSVFGDKKWI